MSEAKGARWLAIDPHNRALVIACNRLLDARRYAARHFGTRTDCLLVAQTGELAVADVELRRVATDDGSDSGLQVRERAGAAWTGWPSTPHRASTPAHAFRQPAAAAAPPRRS